MKALLCMHMYIYIYIDIDIQCKVNRDPDKLYIL